MNMMMPRHIIFTQYHSFFHYRSPSLHTCRLRLPHSFYTTDIHEPCLFSIIFSPPVALIVFLIYLRLSFFQNISCYHHITTYNMLTFSFTADITYRDITLSLPWYFTSTRLFITEFILLNIIVYFRDRAFHWEGYIFIIRFLQNCVSR